MKKWLWAILLLAAPAMAQFTPPAGGAFQYSAGSWVAATTTATTGAISFTPPPIALYCYNSSLNQWVPLTSACFGGGSGTVTSFSSGNLSPLFTTSVATATTTPALSFTLSNAAANTVFAGPASGGSGAPSFQTAPTISAANMTNFPSSATTYPGAGIANSTGSAWGTSYGASNPIPAQDVVSNGAYPVQLATTGSNITLSGEQAIDGVTTSSSTVLVKDQTTASQNGVYTSGSGAWTRQTGFSNVVQGTQVFVSQGTANYNTTFNVTTANPITLGTSALNFYASVPSAVTNPSYPCDILAAASTPCVAAHSMTRKMLAAYSGNLFQVLRASDSTTQDIGTLSSGLANVAAITTFCASTTCTISKIYDQMNTPSSGNNLPQATVANQAVVAYTNLPNGLTLPILRTLSTGGYGEYYRNRASTVGLPTGNSPITEYMVAENFLEGGQSAGVGTYGDMEATVADTGPGHMFALAYSTGNTGGVSTGTGPWAGVDLENGTYSYSATPAQNYVSVFARYNTSGTAFTVKTGDATQGRLVINHAGALPAGYTMNMEGGISLGEGGDGTQASVNFLEGVVVASATTDSTDAAVQANLTSFYGPSAPTSPTFVGSNNIFHIIPMTSTSSCASFNTYSSVFIGPVQNVGGSLCASLNITQTDSVGNTYMRIAGGGGTTNAGQLLATSSGLSIGTAAQATKAFFSFTANSGMTIGSTTAGYQSLVVDPISGGNASAAISIERPGVGAAGLAVDAAGDLIIGNYTTASTKSTLIKQGVTYNGDWGTTGTVEGGWTYQGVAIARIGTAIASATTIAPVSPVTHITGTTTISTITAPGGCTTSGLGCQLTLIPDGLFSTATGGNIAVATTAIVSKAIIMTYDPATTLWYPSY